MRHATSLAFLLIAFSLAHAEPQTGSEVLDAARAAATSVQDKSMRVTMRVRAPDGGEATKTLSGYETHEPGARRVLWLFEKPHELSGTGFLAWQQSGKADALWVYFPGQSRVRRVPPSVRRRHFQGSLFTYEDLVAIFFLDFEGEHTLEGRRACGEAECFIVRSELRPDEFAYQRVRTWIDTATLLPHRVEFFTERLVKEMQVTEVRVIDGIPSITRVVMKDPVDGYTTEVALEDVVYNQSLHRRLFTIESLYRRGR